MASTRMAGSDSTWRRKTARGVPPAMQTIREPSRSNAPRIPLSPTPSIGDHSAYLLGAKNGSKLRYAGLKGCTDYKKAIQIIKDGGYATDTSYVSKICSIIERWNLTQYDSGDAPAPEPVKWYRVRKSWSDSKSQKGAYKILENAKKCADENPGYSVFDNEGVCVYTPKAAAPEPAKPDVPFLVKVAINKVLVLWIWRYYISAS